MRVQSNNGIIKVINFDESMQVSSARWHIMAGSTTLRLMRTNVRCRRKRIKIITFLFTSASQENSRKLFQIIKELNNRISYFPPNGRAFTVFSYNNSIIYYFIQINCMIDTNLRNIHHRGDWKCFRLVLDREVVKSVFIHLASPVNWKFLIWMQHLHNVREFFL